MMIDQGTPIIDVACGVCGGTVTVVSGKRDGDYLKGRCDNTLSEGGVCGTWFTVGKNPSFLLKQNFIKSKTQEATNDNPAEIETKGTKEPEADPPHIDTHQQKHRNRYFKG